MNVANWSEWYRFDSQSTQVPNSPGVYEIRTDFEFGRLKGKSSIVYIGKTTRSLRKRLLDERRDNPSRFMSRAEKVLLQAGHTLEFRYAGLTGKETVEQFEMEELMEYEKEHWELPPGNGNLPRKRVQRIGI